MPSVTYHFCTAIWLGNLLCYVQVLVLADNTFQPFPTDTSAATTALQALSGEVLHLRERGLHARNAFEQEVHFVDVDLVVLIISLHMSATCSQLCT